MRLMPIVNVIDNRAARLFNLTGAYKYQVAIFTASESRPQTRPEMACEAVVRREVADDVKRPLPVASPY